SSLTAKPSPWQRVVRCRLNRQPSARRSSEKSSSGSKHTSCANHARPLRQTRTPQEGRGNCTRTGTATKSAIAKSPSTGAAQQRNRDSLIVTTPHPTANRVSLEIEDRELGRGKAPFFT